MQSLRSFCVLPHGHRGRRGNGVPHLQMHKVRSVHRPAKMSWRRSLAIFDCSAKGGPGNHLSIRPDRRQMVGVNEFFAEIGIFHRAGAILALSGSQGPVSARASSGLCLFET